MSFSEMSPAESPGTGQNSGRRGGGGGETPLATPTLSVSSWGGFFKQAAATLEDKMDKVFEIAQNDADPPAAARRGQGFGFIDPETGFYTAAEPPSASARRSKSPQEGATGGDVGSSSGTKLDRSSAEMSAQRPSTPSIPTASGEFFAAVFGTPSPRISQEEQRPQNDTSPGARGASARATSRSDIAAKGFLFGAAAARKALLFAQDTARVAASQLPPADKALGVLAKASLPTGLSQRISEERQRKDASAPAVNSATPRENMLGDRSEDRPLSREGGGALIPEESFSEPVPPRENELAVERPEFAISGEVPAAVEEPDRALNSQAEGMRTASRERHENHVDENAAILHEGDILPVELERGSHHFANDCSAPKPTNVAPTDLEPTSTAPNQAAPDALRASTSRQQLSADHDVDGVEKVQRSDVVGPVDTSGTRTTPGGDRSILGVTKMEITSPRKLGAPVAASTSNNVTVTQPGRIPYRDERLREEVKSHPLGDAESERNTVGTQGVFQPKPDGAAREIRQSAEVDHLALTGQIPSRPGTPASRPCTPPTALGSPEKSPDPCSERRSLEREKKVEDISRSAISQRKRSATQNGLSAEDLKRIIEQRERQLMTAMKENASMTEVTENLRVEVRELEKRRSAEAQAAAAQIRRLEEQLAHVAGDRDEARKALVSMGSAQKALMEQAQQLRDKDQQIAGLMEEGQKLSIIELKSSQMIKKQRAKDAEQEKTIKDLEKRLSESQLDASQLKERVARMAENEKKFNDSVKAVNDTNERQTKELIRLEQELSKTQSALETALQELSHARRQNAEATAAAQSDALDVEVKAKEVALRTLEAVQVDAQAAQASAKKEIEELRIALSRAEEQAGWIEDDLRQEIASLQLRLQATEERNADVAAGLQDSTRPLLRQIEVLQAQNAVALRDWEEVERALTHRLREAQAQLDVSAAKMKAEKEKAEQAEARAAALESELNSEQSCRAQVAVELEASGRRQAELERNLEDLSASIANLKLSHQQALRTAEENYRRLLKQQVTEQIRALEERHRTEERVRLAKEREGDRARHGIRPSASPPSASPASPVPGSDRQDLSKSRTPSVENVRDSSAIAPGASVLPAVAERPHAVVRHLEGQIASLHAQLQAANKGRGELADEMVRMTTEVERLKEQAAAIPQLEAAHAELQVRHDAALELLGEKTEQASELQADIADLKEAYRSQITDLIEQVNRLTRQQQQQQR